MIYKNLSRTTKTFYGVTFNPGESHEVPGYINNKDFITVSEPDEPKKSSKSSESVAKSDTSKIKEEVKPDGSNSNK